MKRLQIFIISLLLTMSVFAQTDTIRYVLKTDNGGSTNNTGLSWDNAKDNIQDAIKDLQNYLKRYNLTSGRIYVGAGIYTPTASTEESGDGILYTSFLIPEGISVYGGFTPTGKKYQRTITTDALGKKTYTITKDTNKNPLYLDDYQLSPNDRYMRNGKTQEENEDNSSDRHRIPADKSRAWDFDEGSYTYLSGNHSTNATGDYLTWNSARQHYDEAFPGNSYHVVWFGTNGKIESDNDTQKGHYKPLEKAALIDGFYICGGNASNKELNYHNHTSYGGGVYMVKGATVRNCRITENAAARRGGAIYMDGGGMVDHCFIQKNSAAGVGMTDGYGGGVAMDLRGTVRHSIIVDNGASIGGGLTIEYNTSDFPSTAITTTDNNYAPSAAGCVIANNTATIEGGGVALLSGGTVNHNTIVRNHCSGNTITIDSRRYGRSGGLFIDTGGAMYNSVVWGNTTQNNGNTQYSSYVPVTSSTIKPYIYFSAFSNHDDAEWTGTDKLGVIPLQEDNDRENSGRNMADYYAEFISPSTIPDGTNIAGVENSGRELNTNWKPSNHSDLVGKGLRLADFITKEESSRLNAAINRDIYGNHLAPTSTLGAYMSESIIENIVPATGVLSLETGGTDANANLYTLFVDPEYARGKEAYTNRGNSWDNPLVFIGDALHYIEDEQIKNPSSDNVYQILVKEGTASVANRQANVHIDNTDNDRIRLRDLTTSIPTGVRVYGSFYNNLTGTNLKEDGAWARDPLLTPTIITANVTGLGYDDNVAHVVTLDGVSNVVFDGFKLYAGNTTVDNTLEEVWEPSDANGAGIWINGGSDNTIRNCFIANCTASEGHGAAIYAKGSTDLLFENLVIHNNGAYNVKGIKYSDTAAETDTIPSAVLITQGATATFKHCLFRGNVGALVSDSSGSQVSVTYSAFHANGTRELDGENVEGGALKKNSTNDLSGYLRAIIATNSGTFADCADNLIDDDLGDHDATGTKITPESHVKTSPFYAVFNHDPQNNTNYTYPSFTNPTTTIGVNPSGLITYYGGSADFTPGNMNPMVNAANDTGTDTDLTTHYPRNRGGKADVGPIENTNLPASGEVLYVTPNGAGKKDGSSWSNAIAGNSVYQISGTTPFQDDNGNEVPTTDTRYAGIYNATSCPYGEESGAYKDFWSAGNTYSSTTANIKIQNKRSETYVSGLQFAVEQASKNATADNQKKVWVAAGKYTDWKGYVIRDNVEVYGGFPGKDGVAIGNPGKDERHPLLSNYIPMREQDAGLTTTQYETILQIQETAPVTWNGTTPTANSSAFTTGVVRKPVLFQPDVCLTTYSPNKNGAANDNISNTDRTTKDALYVGYKGASWDGFVVRHGYYNGYNANRDGGAGLRIFENISIRNCVVVDNYNQGSRNRGGGIYCDGQNTVFENCFIIRNVVTGDESYGGGMYQIVGTTFNSCIATNYAGSNGGGVFVENASLYNNTIAYNNASERSQMSQWSNSGAGSKLLIYNNLIVAGSSTAAVGTSAAESFSMYYSYVVGSFESNIPTTKVYNTQYGTSLTNPFMRGTAAGTSYNFRLDDNAACINKGTENIPNVTLPIQDVDFSDRVKDCTIDIGAYEYNGAKDISYATITEGDITKHVYYVTQNGSGLASANSPENAACWKKLQKVLDAAGRHKYELLNDNDDTNDDTEIVVRLAQFGSFDDKDGYYTGYAPTEEVLYDDYGGELRSVSNPLSYSLLVPRGITLEGGWCLAHNEIPITGVTLNKTTTTLTVGSTEQLVATVEPSDATDDTTITWTSSDKAVATVTADGIVTAIADGTATITATTSNGKTATCTVTVASFKVVSGTVIKHGDYYLYWDGSKVAATTSAPTTEAEANNYFWTIKTKSWGTTYYNIQNDGTQNYLKLSSSGVTCTSSSNNISGKNTGSSYGYYTSVTSNWNTSYYYLTNNETTVTVTSGKKNTTDYNYWTNSTKTFNVTPSSSSAKAMNVDEVLPQQKNSSAQNDNSAKEQTDAPSDTEAAAKAAVIKKAGTVTYADFGKRDPLKYKSYLTGRYTTDGKVQSNVYHVVTFTEMVYDAEHNPMYDETGEGENKTKVYHRITAGRTVIDGCFITGGKAIGQEIDRIDIGIENNIEKYNLINSYYNPDNYGGAAIVPSYGHIRNCVIEKNNSTSGGGALMLKPKALVSGCILRNNTTSGNGGAIYVYEPSKKSTDKTYIAKPTTYRNPSDNIDYPAVLGPEWSYANIFTTTIVGNTAGNGGGGIYFGTTNPNLRMNSSVLWRNTANSNANIAGQLTATSLTTTNSNDQLAPWEYPLQYCAIENQRAAGYNNISVASESTKGVRWNYTFSTGETDADLISNETFFYDLKDYSLLAHTGMLMSDYNTLINGMKDDTYDYFPTLETADIAKVNRTTHTENSYIEIGARAYDGSLIQEINEDHIMQRIFVAMPEETNLNNAEIMQNNNFGTTDWRHNYYAQAGSSMAYPMNRLDDALEYIQRVRKKAFDDYNKTGATSEQKTAAQNLADLRFEIFVGNGTHYPYRTMRGAYSNTRGNTFLVPEGVSIYGGIDAKSATILGPLGFASGDDASLIVTDGKGGSVPITKKTTQEILTGRATYDVNQNGIIEGWELKNQTVLSGDVVNSANTKNVFHVMTAVAAEEYVGLLPRANAYNSAFANADGTPKTETITVEGEEKEITKELWDGSDYFSRGLPIILDGLQISDGEAMGYESAVQSNSTYYKGGAICVDGNWVTGRTDGSGGYIDQHMERRLPGYAGFLENIPDSPTGDMTDHDRAKRAVGYRNIPLVVRNSLLTNNKACMGGAIFANGELQIYSSQLSQNLAQQATDENIIFGKWIDHNNVEQEDKTPREVKHNGRGGAVDASYLARFVNVIFANNSALSGVEGGSLSSHHYVDKNGNRRYLDNNNNLLEVGNENKTKPATYNVPDGTGGAIVLGEHSTLQMINCDVVNNKADGYPGIYTFAPNAGYKVIDPTDKTKYDLSVNRNMVVNSVFWGNKNILQNSASSNTSHYEWLMNPVSSYRYEGTIVYDENNTIKSFDIPQALWFCAYEPDRWYEPKAVTLTDDTDDFRRASYTYGSFVPLLLKTFYNTNYSGATEDKLTNVDRLNFNMHINSDNNKSDGPNFISPSLSAGVEGYMPSADWMMSRMNNLVDQGWTYMNQEVETSSTYFVDANKNAETVDGFNASTAGYGPYYQLALEVNKRSTYYDVYDPMPVLSNRYMSYNDSESTKLLRVSLDPNPSHLQTYIDIGAYEYPHVTLNTSEDNNQTDILWVTQYERQDVGLSDGSTWEKATSDLQRAIETLLSSRNDHKKEIRILDGTLSPRYTISDYKAFIINTSSFDLNSTTPNSGTSLNDGGFGIQSLTIRGGYSRDVKGLYDIKQYPTTLSIVSSQQNSEQDQHVLVVKDASQRVKAGGNYTKLDCVIPITIEGIIFANDAAVANSDNGGAAIYYEEQMNATTPLNAPSTVTKEDETIIYTPTGEPKLTLKNCVFKGISSNMAESAEPRTAVTIGQGGGSALIYNSLWNDNAGNTIEAVNTKIINCTFAQNGKTVDDKTFGKMKLDAASELHNSLLWKNGANKTATTDAACTLAAEIDNTAMPTYKYNAITGYSVTSDNDNDGMDDTTYNSPLSIDNDNVLTGPNFTSPTTQDYTVLPSMRVTSRASAKVFMEKVNPTSSTEYTESTALTALQTAVESNVRLYTIDNFEKAHSADYLKYHDLANKERLFDGGLERGAYESITKLNRVMYLQPDKTILSTGENWANAYAGSQLQTAINAGAVYSSLNSKMSYIFAKGDQDHNLGDITMHNGVSLYGSIQTSFTNEAGSDSNDDVNNFINKVVYTPERAMAGPATDKTLISGVRADTDNIKATIDGFDITPKTTDERTTPVVLVGDKAQGFAIRNSIVHDFNMAEGTPVVEIGQGRAVLYNSLLRDVTINETTPTTPIIKLPADESKCHTYVVNCTAVYPTGFTLTGLADWNNYGSKHYRNSLAYSGNVTDDAAPFAPYFQEKNNFFYHDQLNFSSFTQDKNLWYQLIEDGQQIGGGSTDLSSWPANNDDRTFVNEVIKFSTDRDLLGNPRKITDTDYIDIGCYETWSTSRSSSNTSNVLRPNLQNNAINFYGNYYPHQGSVVYVQQNDAIVLDHYPDDYGTEEDEVALRGKPYFDESNPFSPSYLLLRDGASLYGQGNRIKLSYLSVQRNLEAQYNLISLPFNFKLTTWEWHDKTRYANFANVEYKPLSDGQGSGIFGDWGFSTDSVKVYSYDGDKRAKVGYRFHGDSSSPCWKAYADNTVIPANEGWLLDLGEAKTGRKVRFNAFGSGVDDYIYEEGATDADKFDSLKQHDKKIWSTDDGDGFTSEYDMGWNLAGIPYLVADYPMDRVLESGDDRANKQVYAMSTPRPIYDLNNSGTYNARNSWEASTNMPVGKAYFMQTFTDKDSEELYFALPMYSWSTAGAKAAPILMLMPESNATDIANTGGDYATLHPSQNGHLHYMGGADAAKLMPMTDNATLVYILSNNGHPIANLSAAPLNTDIPLGVKLPKTGNYTFSLPNPEAFCLDSTDGEALPVWLTDHATNTVTLLSEQSYTMQCDNAADISDRFTITLGMRPGTGTAVNSVFKLTPDHGYLKLNNLAEGTVISVYTPNGMHVCTTTATSHKWSMAVPDSTVYIIKLAAQ